MNIYQYKYTYTGCSVKRTPNFWMIFLHIIFSENIISLYVQLSADRYEHFSVSSYCAIFYLFGIWSSEGHIVLKDVNKITFRHVP
jgi:hypothetical protein